MPSTIPTSKKGHITIMKPPIIMRLDTAARPVRSYSSTIEFPILINCTPSSLQSRAVPNVTHTPVPHPHDSQGNAAIVRRAEGSVKVKVGPPLDAPPAEAQNTRVRGSGTILASLDPIIDEADVVTRFALRCSIGICSVLTFVLIPVGYLTKAATGCLLVLTLGIFGILAQLLWMPLAGLLMATSWLWIRVWPLRPLLFLPGLLTVIIAFALVALILDDSEGVKSTAIMAWPLSWYAMRPPVAAKAIEPWREPPTEG